MNQKLRILSIIPYKILPAKLGGEKGIAVFNEYLCQQVELTGFTTRNNDPVHAKGYRLVNTISNSRLRYINVFLYFEVRKLLKKTASNVFLIEHPYFGWLAWLIKKTTRVQIVVHSHNMEYMRSKSIGRWWWKALQWYEAWVYSFADKVFFISEDDLRHAVRHLHTNAKKSLAVTYGIEQSRIPGDIEVCRKQVRAMHAIPVTHKILLFNGALYHSTNYDALKVILDHINPVLLQKTGFEYSIIVCGKGLPGFFNNLADYKDANVIYAGFVDNISIYFKAADVFLNPILSGGGVKTKAIEALAMNCTVVSTPLGALGLNANASGEKLKVVEEGMWQQFAEEVVNGASRKIDTPKEFFEYYYWENIIRRAVRHLQS